MQPEQPPSVEPREALNSWKEIAAFLNVSVRTAQLWEEERGLPVRRLPGVKGRVYAYLHELVAWREGAAVAQVGTGEAAEEAVPARRRWWLWAAPAAVALAAVLVWYAFRPHGVPSSYRLEGQSLVVRGADGAVLWTHRFPSPPTEWWEGDASFSRPFIADIDLDGEQELLFPMNSGGAASPANGEFLCFSASGGEKWRYKLERKVRTGDGKTWAPPFNARLAARVPDARGGPDRLLLLFTHATDCPSAAILVDSRGRMLREYWHAGHFSAVMVDDLMPGGGPEIYLGAISNANKTASLIVLDPETFEGAAAEANPKYQILDMAAPRELARVLFNRLKGGALFSDFGTVATLRNHGGHLVVALDEGAIGRFDASQNLIFGPRLVLEDLTLASMTYSEYRRIQAAGLISSADPDAEIPRLRQLRYLTPWTPAPARSAVPPPPPSD